MSIYVDKLKVKNEVVSLEEIEKLNLLADNIEKQILSTKKRYINANQKFSFYNLLICMFYFYMLFLYIQFIVFIIYFIVDIIIIS